jgi:hypothetical protein
LAAQAQASFSVARHTTPSSEMIYADELAAGTLFERQTKKKGLLLFLLHCVAWKTIRGGFVNLGH